MSAVIPPTLPYTSMGHRPWWVRQLLAPAGWPLCMACLLACLWLLYADSVPGSYDDDVALACCCLLGLAVLWVCRFLLRAFLINVTQDGTLRYWHQAWRWLIPPMIVLIAATLDVKNVPLTLRFQLGHSAMDRAALKVLATSPPYADGWIGLYPATDIRTIPGGMQFDVPGAGPAGQSGFAYCPSPPSNTDDYIYMHYAGNWYIAHRRARD